MEVLSFSRVALLLVQCFYLLLGAHLELSHSIVLAEPKNNFPSSPGLDKRQECVDKRNCNLVRVLYRLNTQKKLVEFCEEYKVLSLIKQCAKTCGHCKLPAPPVPEPLEKECKDDRDCSVLNTLHQDRADLDAYCDAHKGDKAIQECRFTCGFCKAPAPQQCQDERSDCNSIVEMFKNEKPEKMQEYCDYYLQINDPSVTSCRKTCGGCKAPAPPRPAEGCEDTRVGGCRWITEEVKNPTAYCEAWREDAAIRQCRKTCGFCK